MLQNRNKLKLSWAPLRLEEAGKFQPSPKDNHEEVFIIYFTPHLSRAEALVYVPKKNRQNILTSMEGLSHESHSSSTSTPVGFTEQKKLWILSAWHTALPTHPQQLSALQLGCALNNFPVRTLWSPPGVSTTRVIYIFIYFYNFIFTSGTSDATASPEKRRAQPQTWIQPGFVPEQSFIQQCLVKKLKSKVQHVHV